MTDRPHPIAYFDPMWRSNHGPDSLDGWRIGYRCSRICPDAVGSMPVTQNLSSHPKKCPDCGGRVELFIPGESHEGTTQALLEILKGLDKAENGDAQQILANYRAVRRAALAKTERENNG